jgi:hypothetical protein
MLGQATTVLSLTGSGGRGAARYARALLAAAASHEALTAGMTLTQRDLYYSMKSVGDGRVTPAAVAAAVTDLQAHLRQPRAALGVVAAPRGCVGGQLWLGMPGAGAEGGASPAVGWACVADEGPSGRPLPGDVAALLATPASTTAAVLLIVEKDAVFRRLCEDRIWDRLPGGAVLLTSAGWPCAAVKAFAAHLVRANPGALGTVLGVAFTDLLTGVGLGLAVAIVHILWKNYSTPYHFDPSKHLPGMPIHIELSEDVTFLNKAGIKRTLGELPDGSKVVIDARRTVELDPDVKEIIDEFTVGAAKRGIVCELIGFKERPNKPPTTLEQEVKRVAQRLGR